MASRGERSKLSKRLEGNINKVWSKVEKSRRGAEESQRGLMPEAEVGFSAPERPVVESRYNQLKGPWYGGPWYGGTPPWYGMQGGIGGKVFRGNGRGEGGKVGRGDSGCGSPA